MQKKKKEDNLKLSKKYRKIMNTALNRWDDNGTVCTGPTSVDFKAGESHGTNPLISHPGRMHVALAQLRLIPLGSVEVISIPCGCLGDLPHMKFRIIFLGATW